MLGLRQFAFEVLEVDLSSRLFELQHPYETLPPAFQYLHIGIFWGDQYY